MSWTPFTSFDSNEHRRVVGAVGCALVLLTAPSALSSRQQTIEAPADGFPAVASETHQLIASGDVIAIVSTSSMGERSVAVRKLKTGEELLRRTGVATTTVGLHDTHLAYIDPSWQVVVFDLLSLHQRVAWSPKSDERPTTVCLSDSRLFVLSHGRGSDDLASLPLNGPSEGRDATPDVPIPSSPGANAKVACSGLSAVVWSSDGDDFFLWASDRMQVIPRQGRDLFSMSDRFLYARSGASTVSRRPASGLGEWQTLYKGNEGRVSGFSVLKSSEAVILVELSAAGTADAVLVRGTGADLVRKPLASNEDWDRPELWTVTERYIAALGRRNGSAWVLVTAIPAQSESTSEPPRPAGGNALGTDVNSGIRGLAWMERQLGPRFETRQGVTGRLIDSYEDNKRVGWTYDAAIAAIAFAARGRTDAARDLLRGLAHLQNDDGSWEFAYDPDRGVPLKGDRYLGTIAWVVIAANFFEWETADRSFNRMADDALAFVNRFVVRDQTSLAGGVSMGPVAPQTYSTEHNIDAYSAFYWRGLLADRADYRETASKLQAFILRELVAHGDSDEAYLQVGAREQTLYLDAQTWAILALPSPPAGDASPAVSGLNVADRRLRVMTGHLGSILNIVGFREAETAASKVWSEGTEGMVAARLWLGQAEEARSYHQETARMQTASGGIPYASENSEGWPVDPAVAATAWYVLNDDWPPRNPFVPDTRTWLKSYGQLQKNFPLSHR
jgi:hypothetical protein